MAVGQSEAGTSTFHAHQAPPPAPAHLVGPSLTLAKKSVPDTQHRGEGQGAGEEAQEPLGQVEQGPDAHLLQMLVHAREQPSQQGHEHLSVQPHSLLRPRPSAPAVGVPRRPPPPSPPPVPASHHVGPVVAGKVNLADLDQAPEGLLGVGTGLECPPQRGLQGGGRGATGEGLDNIWGDSRARSLVSVLPVGLGQGVGLT